MNPRVAHLTTYASHGGAARAASNLHRTMVRLGIDSKLYVAHGLGHRLARLADRQLWRLRRDAATAWQSPALFGSLSARAIDELNADIVNLHWVTDGFLSVETIGRIETPKVWSMYDMWPFCGTEHYAPDASDARWRLGYDRDLALEQSRGVDLDRVTWGRKRRRWKPMLMVPASRWLEATTRQSALMGSWDIHRIPHVVDEQSFSPLEQGAARRALGLEEHGTVITFLAHGGVEDPRKGFDLLHSALPSVVSAVGPVTVLIVGPLGTVKEVPGVKFSWAGLLTTDHQLQLAYCAAHVVAVPSRQDNLPLSAMEAQSCGRAVVGFEVGGLSDVVDSGRTGILARANDSEGLALGLAMAIDDARGAHRWGEAARLRALSLWAAEPVVSSYMHTYGQA